MNFSIENKESGKLVESFSAVFSKEELQKNIDEQIVKLSPRVKLDGFRAGKVPSHIVKKKFFSEIREKFIEGAVREVFKKYEESSEKKVNNLVKVVLKKFDENEGAAIDFIVDFKPVFELKDFDSFCKKINLIDLQLKDEDKKAVIDIFAQSLKEFEKESKKDPVQDGDLVDFSYECYHNDQLIDSFNENYVYGAKDEEFYFDLKKHLKGVKVGDTKTVEIDFPKDFDYDPSFAGKKMLFKLIVKAIFAPIALSEGEELAKKLGFDKYEDFDSKALELYTNAKKDLVKMYNSRMILDELSKEYDFSIPPSMYMSEFNTISKLFYKNLSSNFNSAIAENMMNLSKKIAKRRVKLRFIVDKIFEDFKLTIEKNDLEKYIQQNVDVKDISKYVRDENFMRRAFESIREEKCIALIFEKAKDKMKLVNHNFVEVDLHKALSKNDPSDDVSDFDEVLKIFNNTSGDF